MRIRQRSSQRDTASVFWADGRSRPRHVRAGVRMEEEAKRASASTQDQRTSNHPSTVTRSRATRIIRPPGSTRSDPSSVSHSAPTLDGETAWRRPSTSRTITNRPTRCADGRSVGASTRRGTTVPTRSPDLLAANALSPLNKTSGSSATPREPKLRQFLSSCDTTSLHSSGMTILASTLACSVSRKSRFLPSSSSSGLPLAKSYAGVP